MENSDFSKKMKARSVKSKQFIFTLLALILGGSLFFPFTVFDFLFLDLNFLISQHLLNPPGFSNELVAIGLDDYSQRALKVATGTSLRPYHAELIRALHAAGAKLIAFDIEFFSETAGSRTGEAAAGRPGPDQTETNDDTILAEEIRQAGNVIAGEITPGNTIPIIKMSLKAVVNLNLAAYGPIPRRLVFYPTPGTENSPPTPALAWYIFLNSKQQVEPPESMRMLIRDGAFWINFRNPPDYFPYISYYDLLKLARERDNSIAAFIKDKVVIIGYITDDFPMPNLINQRIPGFYAHLYASDTLIKQQPLTPAPWWLSILLLGLMLIGKQFIMSTRTDWLRRGSAILLLAGLLLVTFTLFIQLNIWLKYFPFLLADLSLISFVAADKRYLFRKKLKELELRLQELEQEGAKIVQSPELSLDSMLISSLVHDIKNSISNININIDLLETEYGADPKTRRRINLAQTACRDILNLALNMLDISKMEEARWPLKIQQYNYSLLEQMARKAARQILFDLKNIRVTVLPASGITAVRCDIELVDRILHNLFHNAAQYTQATGHVICRAYTNGQEQIISLFSSGKPIPDEQKERIFQKYARTKENVSAYSKGLGLYFCHLAMAVQHGRIWVESSDQGNDFKLAFPL